MSRTTHVILMLQTGDAAAETITTLLFGKAPREGQSFALLRGWGGRKQADVPVFGAAFADIEEQEIKQRLASVEFEAPARVMLLIQADDEDSFAVFILRDGEWEFRA